MKIYTILLVISVICKGFGVGVFLLFFFPIHSTVLFRRAAMLWKREADLGSALLSPVIAEDPRTLFPCLRPATIVLILPTRTSWAAHPGSVPGDEKRRLSSLEKCGLSNPWALSQLVAVVSLLWPAFYPALQLRSLCLKQAPWVKWAQSESNLTSLWLFSHQETEGPCLNKGRVGWRPHPALPQVSLQEHSLRLAGNSCREE